MRDENIDEYQSWYTSVASVNVGSIAAWGPKGSASESLVVAYPRDGSPPVTVGRAAFPQLAPNSAGSRLLVTDYALAGRQPSIWLVETQDLSATKVLAQTLVVDDTSATIAWVGNDSFAWYEEVQDNDAGSRHRLMRGTVDGATEEWKEFADISWIEVSPDGSTIAVAAASSPRGRHELWLFDSKSGRAVAVPGGVDVQYIRWTSDRGGFLGAKHEPIPSVGGADEHFLERDLRPGGMYSWTRGGITEWPVDIGTQVPGQFTVAPDGATLAMTGWRRDGDIGVSSLWIVDIATRHATELTPHTTRPGDGEPAIFSPDGAHLAYALDRRVEVRRIADGRRFLLNPTGTWAAWGSIFSATWDQHGALLFFSNMSPDGEPPGRVGLWRWATDGSIERLATRP